MEVYFEDLQLEVTIDSNIVLLLVANSRIKNISAST